MKHISEQQKVLINRLFDIIAHDDYLLESLAKEMEVEPSELEDIVNNVEL